MPKSIPNKIRPASCKVSVVDNNGSIRLIFTFNKRTIRFNLGLPYTKENLDIAIAKAWEIHNDILFNYYDGNNDKYKIGFDSKQIINEINLGEVWSFSKKIKKDVAQISKDKQWRIIDRNLIFPSYNNSYIDTRNFNKPLWKPILENLVKDGLVKEYLPFYDIRHTFAIKLCRSDQVDLKTISSIIGNSVETLIENYLAVDENL